MNSKSKIIAFEPFSENYKKLEVNIQLNGLNQIQIESSDITVEVLPQETDWLNLGI
jgi:hypothetical protein